MYGKRIVRVTYLKTSFPENDFIDLTGSSLEVRSPQMPPLWMGPPWSAGQALHLHTNQLRPVPKFSATP